MGATQRTAQLEDVFEQLVTSSKDMDNLKAEHLRRVESNLEEKYSIPTAVTKSLLTREIQEIFESEDVRLIGLFVKESLRLDRQQELIDKLFSSAEQKEMEQFYYQRQDNYIELPLEMFPALKLNSTTHSVKMSASMVGKLLESQILNYNYDIQREAQTQKRKNEIIKTPKINQKNVDEMTELLLKGQLKDSTIYFNAAPRTADEGDELIMDEKNHKLYITKGTRLDILDGFHRCLASHRAYNMNPEIEFNFNVVVSNYTTKEAQTWQAQHAKAMPWSTHRVKELQKENRSDKVVAALRANPDVGELISASKRTRMHQLTNFTVLSEAINRYFKIQNRRDEVDVAETVAAYLDDLAQYDIEWETSRADNMLTSAAGITGIIYYASKHSDTEYSTVDFYDFLDAYKQQGDTMKRALDADTLNHNKISTDKLGKIEKIVEEVEAHV